ncbi:hypothetical protein [Streptomyces longisporoflavus]|uniref:hypothetical protein n=1 Tax=Streptomyces longisporoflavus TaxID=28044 RepID=UPI00167DF26F|nr:hypothetical protein [Streptomyces longisporoflavus]
MVTSTQRRRLGAASALLMGAALICACGEKPHDSVGAPAPSQSSGPAGPTSSPAPGASPYVEPGVVDGAPHNGENNAYRRPGDMSPASEEAAEAEAARMTPVLKRLHAKKKWDPESVRAALTGELGYEVVKTGSKGKVLSGNLIVQEMRSRYENDEYITPEGTMIGLRVRKDACVTAFVQPTNYEARANGPFMETGCMEPPTGH